jgi:hypothetical protein
LKHHSDHIWHLLSDTLSPPYSTIIPVYAADDARSIPEYKLQLNPRNAGIVKNRSIDLFGSATEENEYFEEDMIVEFKYDMEDSDKKGFWHWTPIRVRYDKTSELRAYIIPPVSPYQEFRNFYSENGIFVWTNELVDNRWAVHP